MGTVSDSPPDDSCATTDRASVLVACAGVRPRNCSTLRLTCPPHHLSQPTLLNRYMYC